jgi:hypothetical protein
MRASREELIQSIHKINVESAANSIDRFRSTDWTKAKENLDVRFNTNETKVSLLERRVDRVEDTLPRITESLKRVESTLGSNPTNKN